MIKQEPSEYNPLTAIFEFLNHNPFTAASMKLIKVHLGFANVTWDTDKEFLQVLETFHDPKFDPRLDFTKPITFLKESMKNGN